MYKKTFHHKLYCKHRSNHSFYIYAKYDNIYYIYVFKKYASFNTISPSFVPVFLDSGIPLSGLTSQPELQFQACAQDDL